MIFQLLNLVIGIYIFVTTIYIIKPGKNIKKDEDVQLDNSQDENYVDDITD